MTYRDIRTNRKRDSRTNLDNAHEKKNERLILCIWLDSWLGLYTTTWDESCTPESSSYIDKNFKNLEISVFFQFWHKPNFTNIVVNSNYICLYIVHALVAHLTLSVWQYWSPRYLVSVLSTCGGYRSSGLIVASLHKSKQIFISV